MESRVMNEKNLITSADYRLSRRQKTFFEALKVLKDKNLIKKKMKNKADLFLRKNLKTKAITALK